MGDFHSIRIFTLLYQKYFDKNPIKNHKKLSFTNQIILTSPFFQLLYLQYTDSIGGKGMIRLQISSPHFIRQTCCLVNTKDNPIATYLSI